MSDIEQNANASTTIQTGTDGTTITVSGSINERSQLVVPELAGAQIRIDTSGVTRINSLGVANWIRYMAKLSELGVPVLISPLSVTFVTQAGMISNFLGDAKVENFFAPYYCADCDHATETLFDIADEVPASIPCPKCKGSMDFDDEMESYLEFRH